MAAFRTYLLGALGCALALAITGLLALLSPFAQAGDTAALQGFADIRRPLLTDVADVLAWLVNPVPLLLASLLLVGVAFARGRPRLGVMVGGVLMASVLTSELLKPLLAGIRPAQPFGSFNVGAASWPSGHATSSMCLALCAVLVAPRRLRVAAAAAGAAITVGVSFSILELGWHYPSDVLGGYLVAATWVGLGMAALRAVQLREPQHAAPRRDGTASSTLAPALIALAGVGAAAGLTFVRPDSIASFAGAHRSFVFGAVALAGLPWVLAGGLAAGLRRRDDAFERIAQSAVGQ